jgi:ribosomal protein S18 acetylase RimI-like enzyme
MNSLRYQHNTAPASSVLWHLETCDALFMPPLSERLDIAAYASKMKQFATCFECMNDDQLVGLVAMYCNDTQRQQAHITSVSVVSGFQGKGIAQQLMTNAIAFAQKEQFEKITLHVHSKNVQAIQLYHKFGFTFSHTLKDQNVEMALTLISDETRLQ